MDNQELIFIADTSFVVAYLNRRDRFHPASVSVMDQARGVVLPQSVLAEVAYLIQQRIGAAAVADFLESLGDSKFAMAALAAEDIRMTASILRRYADSRIDFVDATVMAVAERLRLTTVLTLDRRDFSIYRPGHCDRFILLPE